MADNISIVLKAVLSNDKKDIEEQIRILSGKIKERLELKLKIDASDLQVLTKQAEEVQKKLQTKTVVKGSQFINTEVERQAFNEITSRIREIRKNVDELAKVDISTNKKGLMTSATLTYYNKELGQTITETMGWSEAQKKVNGELVKLKTFETLGFKYSDNIAKAKQETEKLEKKQKETIGTFQQLIGQQVKSVDVAKVLSQQYGNLEIRGHSLNQTTGAYTVTLKQNAKDNLVLKGAIDQTNGALRVQSQVTQQAKNIQLGFTEQLKIAIERSITWGLAMGALYGNLRKIREGIIFLQDLDKELTEVSMITGMTRDQTRELAQEYARLGAEISKTVTEISAVNKELIRQGLPLEVARERMEAILKLSATANITTEESLGIITSSVNAMKENAEKTSDILLKAGAVSASSAAQIGEAFTKTASSAKATGVSIESLTAILSTMIEITQESPSSLGNSMKTLLARFNKINEETGELNEELNKVQEAFESVGVAFLDSEGQIRNVDSLLADLSIKWNNLDKNTKMYIATQAAGVRQQNRFLAIMENYNRVQEIQNQLTDAAGTSNKQYAEYLKSTEAAANRAKVAMQQMWLNTINSDVIRMYYNFSTALTGVIDNIGLLKFSFSALLTILVLSSNTFKTLRTNISDNAKTMSLGQIIVNSFSTSMVGLQLKTMAATVAVNALYGAITFGLSLAITALISGLSSLVIKKKEYKDVSLDTIKAIGDEVKNVDKLVAKLEDGNLSLEEQYKIQKKIAEILPDATTGYSDQNEALAENIRLIKILNEEKRQELENQALSILSELGGEEDQKKRVKRIAEIKNNIRELKEELDNVESFGSTKFISDGLSIEKIDDSNERLKELAGAISGLYDEQSKLTEEGKKVDNAFKILNETLGWNKKLFFEVTEATEKSTSAQSDNNKQTQIQIDTRDKLNEKLETYTKNVELLEKAENELNENGKLSKETLKNLIEQYDEFPKAIGKGINGINDFIKVQLDGEKNFVSSQIEITKSAIEEAQKRIDALKQEAKIREQFFLAEHDARAYIWQGYVDRGIMTQTEANRRITNDNLYNNPYSSFTSQIENAQKELEELQGIKSFWEYVQGGLGGTKSSSPPSSYQSRLEEYINTLQLIREKEQELTEIQKQKNLADEQNRIPLIQKEIALQQDLIQLNEQLLSQQQQTRQSLADQLSAFSDVVTVASNLETLSVNTSQYNKLTDKQKENLDNLISSFTNLNKSINSSKNAMLDAEVAVKSLNDEITKQANSVADKVIDIYKKMYEQQKQSKLNAIESEMDAEERRHKRVLDNLQEELDEFEDHINRKLKLLDREANTEDFNKQLSKLQTERTDIQNQINVLSLDDSVEARARIFELNKQLADKEEEIEKIKTDRTRDLRKNNLQDELEGYRKEIKEKQNTENKKYDAIKNRLQREKDSITAYYDNLINDERKYAQIREEIISGHLDTVLNDLGIFAENANSKLRNVSESIRNNLLDSIRSVKAELNSLSSSSYSRTGNSSNIHADYIDNNYSGGISAYNADLDRRLKEAQNNRDYDLMQRIIKEKQRIGVLHDGGIIGKTGDKTTELINKLFNVKPNEQLIKGLKGELMIPQHNIIKNFIPNLNGLMMATSSDNGGNVVYNLNLRFDNFRGTKQDGENVFNIVANGLKRMGKK